MTYNEYLELETVFGTAECCAAFDSSILYLRYRLERMGSYESVTYSDRLALIREVEAYFIQTLEARYRAPDV